MKPRPPPPPLSPFASPPRDGPPRARLEDVGDVAGLSEADVELSHRAGDDRLRAVEDDPALLVLVEAVEDERLQIAAGLRDPVSDPPLDLPRDRVRRAEVVEGGVTEEGEDVPR